MGFIDGIIHNLDDQCASINYFENTFSDIKNNINSLLNTRVDDCISVPNLGFSELNQFSADSNEIYSTLGFEIQNMLYEYEPRIKILSISYSDISAPWELSFILRCALVADKFKEFDIWIVFRNNRFCEVL
ncbi:hypothetical protein BKH41_00035 [Helicobacter sp. 12S02232-10]|uniref:GPW/gp25 family protein n=1 Tax=Helicobacter sp. 12S02232-10 TaxID=1476197 RepID=UPI000BA5D053|nr:GPW/gp25 family protein [Helicobacter sp. 12S02232-10]PAF49740.1 hypothetical protein BKH41_00035 [Helicobacter sp. 12S02232-10]